MTDDELLTLALSIPNGEWHFDGDWWRVPSIVDSDGIVVADVRKSGHPERNARAPSQEATAIYIAAANPSAIIAMIERQRAERAEWDAHTGQWKATLDEQRAEIERLRAEVKRLRADWDRHRKQVSGLTIETYELRGEIGRVAQDRDTAYEKLARKGAEVKRLTREREEIIQANWAWKEWCDEYKKRTEAAESALAAAQKRIAELEGALFDIQNGTDTGYGARALGKRARAALAGGTAGDGEQVTQQRRGKP